MTSAGSRILSTSWCSACSPRTSSCCPTAFADILDQAVKRPDDFEPTLEELFRAMANRNGRFGGGAPLSNGGLFDDDVAPPASTRSAIYERGAA